MASSEGPGWVQGAQVQSIQRVDPKKQALYSQENRAQLSIAGRCEGRRLALQQLPCIEPSARQTYNSLAAAASAGYTQDEVHHSPALPGAAASQRLQAPVPATSSAVRTPSAVASCVRVVSEQLLCSKILTNTDVSTCAFKAGRIVLPKAQVESCFPLLLTCILGLPEAMWAPDQLATSWAQLTTLPSNDVGSGMGSSAAERQLPVPVIDESGQQWQWGLRAWHRAPPGANRLGAGSNKASTPSSAGIPPTLAGFMLNNTDPFIKFYKLQPGCLLTFHAKTEANGRPYLSVRMQEGMHDLAPQACMPSRHPSMKPVSSPGSVSAGKPTSSHDKPRSRQRPSRPEATPLQEKALAHTADSPFHSYSGLGLPCLDRQLQGLPRAAVSPAGTPQLIMQHIQHGGQRQWPREASPGYQLAGRQAVYQLPLSCHTVASHSHDQHQTVQCPPSHLPSPVQFPTSSHGDQDALERRAAMPEHSSSSMQPGANNQQAQAWTQTDDISSTGAARAGARLLDDDETDQLLRRIMYPPKRMRSGLSAQYELQAMRGSSDAAAQAGTLPLPSQEVALAPSRHLHGPATGTITICPTPTSTEQPVEGDRHDCATVAADSATAADAGGMAAAAALAGPQQATQVQAVPSQGACPTRGRSSSIGVDCDAGIPAQCQRTTGPKARRDDELQAAAAALVSLLSAEQVPSGAAESAGPPACLPVTAEVLLHETDHVQDKATLESGPHASKRGSQKDQPLRTAAQPPHPMSNPGSVAASCAVASRRRLLQQQLLEASHGLQQRQHQQQLFLQNLAWHDTMAQRAPCEPEAPNQASASRHHSVSSALSRAPADGAFISHEPAHRHRHQEANQHDHEADPSASHCKPAPAMPGHDLKPATPVAAPRLAVVSRAVALDPSPRVAGWPAATAREARDWTMPQVITTAAAAAQAPVSTPCTSSKPQLPPPARAPEAAASAPEAAPCPSAMESSPRHVRPVVQAVSPLQRFLLGQIARHSLYSSLHGAGTTPKQGSSSKLEHTAARPGQAVVVGASAYLPVGASPAQPVAACRQPWASTPTTAVTPADHSLPSAWEQLTPVLPQPQCLAAPMSVPAEAFSFTTPCPYTPLLQALSTPGHRAQVQALCASLSAPRPQ